MPASASDRDDYSLYILRCADGSLYTGIASDVRARMTQHAGGTQGAKYLRGRAPFELLFEQRVGTRSIAQRFEHRVKKLSRTKKLDLVAGRLSLAQLCDLQTSGSSRGDISKGTANTGR